jgi:hypothetical protein
MAGRGWSGWWRRLVTVRTMGVEPELFRGIVLGKGDLA